MSVRWQDLARTLDVGVRDLVVAGRRDLQHVAASLRARAAAGVAVHLEAGRDRGEAYTAEVPIRYRVEVRGWQCTVHGRIDGVEEEEGRTIIEEVKSTALDAERLDRVAGFPEWEEQLALYVWFAAEARMADPVGRLRVVSLVDGSRRFWQVSVAPGVGERVQLQLDRLVRDREAFLAWQTRRRSSVVQFPFPAERIGQKEMREAAFNAVRSGRHLLLTAPTGIGKTASVMTGVLAAAAESGLAVYWATARTTQQAMAERTVAAIAEGGTPIRAVTLRARANACLQPVVDCRPEACRYAEGYQERVDSGLDALLEVTVVRGADAERVGRATQLCPHELTLDHGARADIVIGDYNQAFAPDIHLRLFAGDRPWVLVVDEAHQLLERAREWGSPRLLTAWADEAVAWLEGERWRGVRALAEAIRAEIVESELRAVAPLADALVVELPVARWADLRDRVDEVAWDHARLRPADETGDDPWVILARAVIGFAGALERAGEETVALWDGLGLRLLCRDPARLLRSRFGDAHASVSLSATLSPDWFFREAFGLDRDRTDTCSVPSPFPPEHRHVVMVPGVSTAYKHRDRDRSAIAAVLDRCVAAVPGNTAVYFSSYERMAELCGAATFAGRYVLETRADMGEIERAGILAEILAPGPPRVLCAVLGGSFSEGVDLPGGALKAVVVVGPALPPPGTDRALCQAWYEERYDLGFDLAFVQPGMTRVVQAAGRVIRSEADRAVVVLLCQRFLRDQYRAYLPAEWVTMRSARPWESITSFFAS